MTRAGPHEPGLVLIVEDESPIAEALAEIVADAGYRTIIAGNGRKGLELARAEHPALIITDLMMPFIDGATLIATLHKDAEQDGISPSPVIVMTAAGKSVARNIPADAILGKPFDIREVENLLARFLAGRDGEPDNLFP